MCLTSKKKPVSLRAKKDMVFYKVLAESTYTKTKLYSTPYIGFPVDIGTPYEDPDLRFHWDKQQQPNYKLNSLMKQYEATGLETVYRIGQGGFHLFKNKADAEIEARSIALRYYGYGMANITDNGCPYKYRVFKAIVPKGTLYAYGEYSLWDCVIAKKVKYEWI